MIVPDTDQHRGLIEIMYRGRTVTVFIQDVMVRGDMIERIEVKPAAGEVSIRPGERRAG